MCFSVSWCELKTAIHLNALNWSVWENKNCSTSVVEYYKVPQYMISMKHFQELNLLLKVTVIECCSLSQGITHVLYFSISRLRWICEERIFFFLLWHNMLVFTAGAESGPVLRYPKSPAPCIIRFPLSSWSRRMAALWLAVRAAAHIRVRHCHLMEGWYW